MRLEQNKPKTKKNQKGLTLIEVMVAFLFLSLGLVPLLGIITSSIMLANRIENNLVASNLAQEGIEVVRGIRDAAWMRGDAFDLNLPNGDYLVSWDSDSLISYDSTAFIKISSSGSIYSYNPIGKDTIFKRKITIAKIVSPCNCELRIISEVTWAEKGINKTTAVEAHLFNWR